MGRENLKLNKAQVTAMMNLLRKEEQLEQEEKMKEKEEKVKESGTHPHENQSNSAAKAAQSW